jgi:hypothetical protein
MAIFYSPVELFKRPYFAASLITSLAFVVVVTGCLAFFLKRNRIYIKPTAEIKFVHHNPESMVRVATINAVSEEIGTEATLYGYLGSLAEICNDSIFITKRMNEFVTTMTPVTVVVYAGDDRSVGTKATIGTISENTCSLANNIANNIHKGDILFCLMFHTVDCLQGIHNNFSKCQKHLNKYSE